jgi:hypothetical protein
MQQRLLIKSLSCKDFSSNSNYTRSNAGNRVELDTDLTDVNAVANKDNKDKV